MSLGLLTLASLTVFLFFSFVVSKINCIFAVDMSSV